MFLNFLVDIFAYRCLRSVMFCTLLAITYVGSLYIWGTTHNRDHPSTIRKRFVSVLITSIISPWFVYLGTGADYFSDDIPLSSLLGFRLSGVLSAIVVPVLLTAILFLGPVILHYMDNGCTAYLSTTYWKNSFQNLIWMRNHVVAPLSEEFIFRACMLPILVPCFGVRSSIYICPLFFGVAHLHHLQERLQRNPNFKQAILQSLFQFAYTTLFGIYSAFLFLRTGHFLSTFLVHAFCNHMGFPDFPEIFRHQRHVQAVLITAFVMGLVSWIYLLPYLTQPSLYYNDFYWK